MNDKTLKCIECGSNFVFTAGEQVYFKQRNFEHDPKRCKRCKAKTARGDAPGTRVRAETLVLCSACGIPTTVPFKPTHGRPLYCRACYKPPVRMGTQPGNL